MGCVCRSAPNEEEIKLEIKNKSPKNSNKNIRENIKDVPILCKEKLKEYGDFISEKDFKEFIPVEFQNYIEKNPLKLNSNKDNIFKIEPIEFKNGNSYDGFWNKDLKMDGPGKYYLKQDKVLAEGNWDNGELIYARVFLPNGDIYEGDIKDSQFNGKGKLISTNNDYYEGEFKNGEKTGRGKIIFSDGTIYEGDLNKGEFEGNGKMTWKNGIEYEGEFNGFILNGKGQLTNSEGDYYDGDFDNSLFHGKGKYYFSKNKAEYDGEFQYGVKKGKGIYSTDLYKYDGYWDNDLPCGIGKVTNSKNNGILKCTWRYGKLAEEPIYEEGSEEDFKEIDLNIKPEEMILNVKGLPHLDVMEVDSTQFKLGNSLSFL